MRKYAVLFAVVALFVMAVPALAVESATLDYSSDVTTGLVGFMAGAAASIAAGFGIAILLRATWKAARVGLKAVGLIR
jgi:hypothetical protein